MPGISIEDRYVHVPGGRLFARRWTPEKPATTTPIVLFHDSLGCVGLWRNFPEKLARRVNQPVVAYDRLDFGMSSPREALPSMDFVTEEAEFAFPQRIVGGVTGPAESLILEGCGHVPHRERTEDVLQAVNRHLDSLDPS